MPNGSTISQIMTDAQHMVGEVAGPGVQVFSEDRTFSDVIRAFNMLFTKYPWEQYQAWYDVTLNGTTGLPTTNVLEYVRSFEDFISIHRDGEQSEIPRLPGNLNPRTLSDQDRVLYWTSLPATDNLYATKRLKFYPVTATGVVNVRAKVYPIKNTEQFSDTTELHLDKDLLVYATAFMALSMEDLNNSAAEVCKGLMEQRFKDIMSALGSHEISLGRGPSPVRDWWVHP